MPLAFSVISVLLVKETEVTGENQALLMRENHGSQNVLGVLTWVGGYYYFIPSQRHG
jgi:hypothetical protein